jgi:hypothetical protein
MELKGAPRMETPVSASEPIWSTVHPPFVPSFLLTLALLLSFTHAEAATQYTFKGFDVPLDGVVSTSIAGVAYKSGVMVGRYTDVYGNAHGWRGNSTTATMVPLQPLNGINRLKWTVGAFRPTPVLGAPPSDERQGFIQTDKALIPITVPGCTDVVALGVNDAGAVVGSSCDWQQAWHWQAGVLTLLTPPAEGWGCEAFGFMATGINNAGVIVGSCADTGFIYDQGVYTLFNGTFGQPPQAYVYPNGINDRGTVYGRACMPFDDLFEGECAGFLLKQGVMTFVSYPGAWRTEIHAAHPSNGRIWSSWLDSAGLWHAFTATPKQGSARASEEVASR